MLYVHFREQTVGEKTQILIGLPNPKAVWHLLKMSDAKDIHQPAQQMKAWIMWRNVSLKTE